MNVFSGQNFTLTKQWGPVHCHGESTNPGSASIPDVIRGPLSPTQYWVRSTSHLAPLYAISSIPPLPRYIWRLKLESVRRLLYFNTSVLQAVLCFITSVFESLLSYKPHCLRQYYILLPQYIRLYSVSLFRCFRLYSVLLPPCLSLYYVLNLSVWGCISF